MKFALIRADKLLIKREMSILITKWVLAFFQLTTDNAHTPPTTNRPTYIISAQHSTETFLIEFRLPLCQEVEKVKVRFK